MIRAVLHLLSEAIWAVVFKLAGRRPPLVPAKPETDRVAEEARVRAEWIEKHRRQP